jgi:hypothetical protein
MDAASIAIANSVRTTQYVAEFVQILFDIPQ